MPRRDYRKAMADRVKAHRDLFAGQYAVCETEGCNNVAGAGLVDRLGAERLTRLVGVIARKGGAA